VVLCSRALVGAVEPAQDAVEEVEEQARLGMIPIVSLLR